jgi:hypothetical protein
LSRLRAEQGFPSAYSFYNSRGGRKVFGVAFANYLALEKGGSLPKGSRFKALFSALGLGPESPAVRELLLAYLGDLLGSENLLAGFTDGLSADPAPSSWLLAENAARQTIGQRSVQLTLRQYEALAADGRAYACHVLLANTRGGLTKKELAARTQLSAKDIDAALGKLRSAGLAKVSGSGASSPLAGKYVVPPPPSANSALAGCYARLQAHRRRWIEQHGACVETRYLVLRAAKAKFSQYFPHLADVVSMAAVYGDVTPGPDSQMFLVEGRVTRIFEPI